MMITTFSMSGKGVMDPEKFVAQATKSSTDRRKKVRLTLIGAMPRLKNLIHGQLSFNRDNHVFQHEENCLLNDSCMKIKTNRECFD
jgi:hypothetical protein